MTTADQEPPGSRDEPAPFQKKPSLKSVVRGIMWGNRLIEACRRNEDCQSASGTTGETGSSNYSSCGSKDGGRPSSRPRHGRRSLLPRGAAPAAALGGKERKYRKAQRSKSPPRASAPITCSGDASLRAGTGSESTGGYVEGEHKTNHRQELLEEVVV